MKRAKYFVIFLAGILFCVFPAGEEQSFKTTLISAVSLFVFSWIIPSYFIRGNLRNRVKVEKPALGDPLNEKYPMTYVQFLGYLFLACGVGGIVGGIIVGQWVNYVGVDLLAVGLGILTSMTIELRRVKVKSKRRD